MKCEAKYNSFNFRLANFEIPSAKWRKFCFWLQCVKIVIRTYQLCLKNSTIFTNPGYHAYCVICPYKPVWFSTHGIWLILWYINYFSDSPAILTSINFLFSGDLIIMCAMTFRLRQHCWFNRYKLVDLYVAKYAVSIVSSINRCGICWCDAFSWNRWQSAKLQ